MEMILIVYALTAAFVAMLVRFQDWPVTVIDRNEFVKAFIGSLVAVGFAMWFMMAGDADIYRPEMFAVVAGAGVGGMSFVGGIMEQYGKIERQE